MYLMKETDKIKVIKQVAMAKVVGLNPVTINKIFNRKQKCSKLVAYCITKFLDDDKEIEEFFERVED